ncbi:MAG: DUF2065 domain-containing protein [Pseudomonadota bacterium]
MQVVLLALGLVAILEGLALALAPDRLEDILRTIANMPPETRRLIGLLAITAGGILMTVGAMIPA